MQMIRGFDGPPDFLLVFDDAIGHGDVGLVRSIVQFQIIELEKDAQLVGGREFLAEARADSVRVEDELAGADLAGGYRLDLVSKDQRACIELVVLKVRDAQSGIEYAEVAAEGVLNNEIETIKAGTKWNGFLVNGREIQG